VKFKMKYANRVRDPDLASQRRYCIAGTQEARRPAVVRFTGGAFVGDGGLRVPRGLRPLKKPSLLETGLGDRPRLRAAREASACVTSSSMLTLRSCGFAVLSASDARFMKSITSPGEEPEDVVRSSEGALPPNAAAWKGLLRTSTPSMLMFRPVSSLFLFPGPGPDPDDVPKPIELKNKKWASRRTGERAGERPIGW